MSIIEDLISTLNMEARVKEIRQGLFYTAVLTRNCGLAATLPRDILEQEQPSVAEAGLLLDNSTAELIKMAYSNSIAEAAIGMATINSLLQIKEDECIELNAGKLIAEKGAGKRVAMVGHFPFVASLRGVVRELWIIEKNPLEGDLSKAEAANYLPEADVIGITGTAFTNHTIERLLELCNPDAYVVLLGGTVPMSSVLFDYGIDALSGTKVIDLDSAMRHVSQGANYRQLRGVRQLTMTGNRR